MIAILQAASKPLVLVFVVSTMFGVGLLLTARQLAAPLRDVRLMASALLANFVLVPCAALAVIWLTQLDTSLGAALLLLATVPGAPILVKLTAIARGDQALAVGLVVLLMLISIVYQPLVLPLLIHGVAVSPGGIVRTLMLSVLLPLILGLLLRAQYELLAMRLRPLVDKLSTFTMLLVVFALPALHFDALVVFLGSGGLVAAVLFVTLGVAAGWLSGGPQPGSQRILALCCGQGNMAAAFVVATQNFADPDVVVMLLVVMLVGAFTLIPLTLVFRRRVLFPPKR